MSFVIVWQFQVLREHQEELERAYGPNGDWARFFGRSDGYRGTELLRETSAADEGEGPPGGSRRFLTLDRWDSRDAYDDFNTRFESEYQQMDERFLELCELEVCLGKFELVE